MISELLLDAYVSLHKLWLIIVLALCGVMSVADIIIEMLAFGITADTLPHLMVRELVRFVVHLTAYFAVSVLLKHWFVTLSVRLGDCGSRATRPRKLD